MRVPRINLLAMAIMCWTLAGAVAIVGCSTTPPGKAADYAAHADHGTTIAALAADGVTEANPLAPVGPLRYAVHRWAEGQRCADRGVLRISTAVGAGAAVNNVLAIAGAAWHPVGLLAAVPAYLMSADCRPHLLPEHRAMLAQWEAAYEAGDAQALPLDNPELLARYADLFERTTARQVTYSDAETVRGGFIARYVVALQYPDRESERSGELRFEVESGRVTEAG